MFITEDVQLNLNADVHVIINDILNEYGLKSYINKPEGFILTEDEESLTEKKVLELIKKIDAEKAKLIEEKDRTKIKKKIFIYMGLISLILSLIFRFCFKSSLLILVLQHLLLILSFFAGVVVFYYMGKEHTISKNIDAIRNTITQILSNQQDAALINLARDNMKVLDFFTVVGRTMP